MPNYDQPSEDGNAPVRDAPTILPAKLFLVCGGRDFQNRDAVYVALDSLHRKYENLSLIHGAARGADTLAHEWAILNECPVIAVPAKWSTHGNSAGPRRNALMLHYLPDGVVAFAGGSGTADMCRQAEAAGVKVWRP
jgi:hypothetical protein